MAKEKEPMDPDVLFDPKVIYRVANRLYSTESGCIEIDGRANADGYVQISVGDRENQRKVNAHRWALQLAMGGVILPTEVFACHHCDNPRCIRPTHLFPGNHDDNMADMVAKGRAAICRGNAHLSLEEVAKVKGSNDSLTVISEALGIAKSTASYIRNGKTWTEVEPIPWSFRSERA